MTGNFAFEIVVVLVTSIDCGCQSRSFISRIESETCADAGLTVASTRKTLNDANAMRFMPVLPGVSSWQVCAGYQTTIFATR